MSTSSGRIPGQKPALAVPPGLLRRRSKWGNKTPSTTAAVLSIHKPVPEQMLDEEASIAENDEVLVDVMVCAHCCHLAYPEGCEDYYDPDVFWPCPTARAVGVIPQELPDA